MDESAPEANAHDDPPRTDAAEEGDAPGSKRHSGEERTSSVVRTAVGALHAMLGPSAEASGDSDRDAP